MGKKKVTIVIPLSNTSGFTESESISLRHLEYYLSEYDRFFIAPKHLKIDCDSIPAVRMPNKYFGSLNAHSRLSLSFDFYDRFSDYDYMLMYHLDCLVFGKDLDKWCNLGYDLLGPPWIKGPDLPWLDEEATGNTGFSLRKISAFKKLLSSHKKWEGPRSKITKIAHSSTIKDGIKKTCKFIESQFPGKNNIQAHIEHFIENNGHDDRFLKKYATKYYSDFQFAPVETALQFGFEANPRICFKRNDFKMPFGCHAWERYDKEFWKPFLLD